MRQRLSVTNKRNHSIRRKSKRASKVFRGGADRSVSPTNAIIINPRTSANIGPYMHRQSSRHKYLQNQRLMAENSLRRKGIHINAPSRALDVGQYFDSVEYNRPPDKNTPRRCAMALRQNREQSESMCNIT